MSAAKRPAGKKRRFQAEIKPGSRGGAYVVVPFDVGEAFGVKGRVPVRATFDGEVYQGSVFPMGGNHLIGIRRAIREAIGKDVGDMVSVVLEPEPLTTTPRR